VGCARSWQHAAQRKIKGFIPESALGDTKKLNPSKPNSQLAIDPDFDRGNAGITIIILFSPRPADRSLYNPTNLKRERDLNGLYCCMTC
jgi:hypothetical protein